jgi:DHA1 family bicyclomycin/chloramphenicol resistance-like MFS transporter
MDMNLPALPAIADHFGVAVSETQLMLTSFLVGLAAGQILFGALSDAYGRRRPFMAGLVGYIAASVACALSPSIEILIASRVLQGLGSAAAIVTARAIVRDMYTGSRAAQYLSRLTLVVGLAPVLAPSLGAQVLRVSSWRGIFLVLAIVVLMILVVASIVLPESLPSTHRRPARVGTMIRTFDSLLRDREFLGFAIALGLANATTTFYIAGSPFVLHRKYGLSPQGLGLVFGVNAVALIACSQFNAFLVRRHRVLPVLIGGLALSAINSVVLLAFTLRGGPGLIALIVFFFVTFGLWGFIPHNAIVLAMAKHPLKAGSAAALLGVAQWGFAGLVAPLVGLGGDNSVAPLAVGMALSSCLALAILVLVIVRAPSVARLAPQAEAPL